MKKTSLIIDEQIVEKAKAILHASTITETIHRALSEVVSRNSRQHFIKRLVEMDGLELDDSEIMKNAWK